ncbi:GAP family protein [Nocardia sp. BSTN01]|uniref:GAP family protein n=1 Tax=Nocardia sp. BSTN01 TaxID=2783665 RepID=UPI00188EB9AB|nr:GAP family protein [Nocardia sp. BSTN01]MBF4999019.1 GAP family protein [Nocardia sp. BSTN01]
MGAVLGDLLPLAVGVAISPIPIVAAILIILSANAARAGTGFAIGWVLGIVVVTAIFVVLSGTLSDSQDTQSSTVTAWVKIVLGIVLLGLAAMQWRSRSDTGVPGWMRAIDTLSAVGAVGLGALLSAVNPKNLLLCVSAGVAIGTSGIGGGPQVIAVLVFTVIAAASVLVVVIGYLVAAERLREPLDRARRWLQANNHVVMAIVLLVMGAVVLGKGIGGL